MVYVLNIFEFNSTYLFKSIFKIITDTDDSIDLTEGSFTFLKQKLRIFASQNLTDFFDDPEIIHWCRLSLRCF